MFEQKWDKFKAAAAFLRKNVREPGVNKKVIRCLDTTATILGLTGLVLGLLSAFAYYALGTTAESLALADRERPAVVRVRHLEQVEQHVDLI